jgi:hypothetical protein
MAKPDFQLLRAAMRKQSGSESGWLSSAPNHQKISFAQRIHGASFLIRKWKMWRGEMLINGGAESGNNGGVSLLCIRIHGRWLLNTRSNKGEAQSKG